MVNLLLKVLLHLVKEAHKEVAVRLDFFGRTRLFERLFTFLLPSFICSFVFIVLLLVSLVESVHILQGLAEGSRHLLIQVLMVALVLVQSI